ncbi:MAG: 50S ribosomal protein L10 [Clostridia bacterium]|nr:50S ribosomal protein L10 [Clostridia bacterium]
MPSNKILNEKKAIVGGLADEFKNAQTMVVADYRGLTVAQDTEMRAAMRKAGITYKVVKNTLATIAAEQAGLGGMTGMLKGPTAIAYSAVDMVAPAKLVKEFATKYPALEIKGGSMSGEILDVEGIQRLAAVPPKEILYGQVVSGLISPIAGLVMLLGAVSKKAEETGAANVSELTAAVAG